MDDEKRLASLAANESVYRQVNEEIERLGRRFSEIAAADTIEIVCECGDLACARQLKVDIATYERVRADPTLFIVTSGHDIREVEDVVETHGHFDIVCKHKGVGADVARATDPRG